MSEGKKKKGRKKIIFTGILQNHVLKEIFIWIIQYLLIFPNHYANGNQTIFKSV